MTKRLGEQPRRREFFSRESLRGRLRAGDERIRPLQLRFDRGAVALRRRRQLRAQLVPFLFAVPTSMDFGEVQTATHDEDPLR
jgi:hypothetical protein